MKKLPFSIFSMAAAMILATVPACSVKEDIYAEEEGEGIVLRFFSDESLVVTKSKTQKDGVDALNENVLASVEYFLYSNANKNGDAVIHGYLENVRQNAPISVPMTSDLVNYTLCPNNATNFWVYAIANHDRIVAAGDPENLSGTDVATLSAKTRDLELDGENVKTPQSSFLMATDGIFEVTPVRRRNTIVASANVGLKRVAAKITVSVRVVPQVEIRNTVTISGVTDTRTEIWKPRLNEAYVYLVNGAKTGQVSGEPVEGSEPSSYAQANFDLNSGENYSYKTYTKKVDEDGNEILDANGLVQYTEETKTGIFYPAEIPFYTYPETWKYGTEEEPYLKLAIPWDREPGVSDGDTPFGSTSKIYYYRVYCPATAIDISNAEFLRNNWYKVVLNVGILGSEMDGGEMIINGQYYVVDWQERETSGGGEGTGVNDSDKEAEIKGARYLFINEDEFTMYNLEDLMIPYVTSDPCEIVDFQAIKYDFSGSSKQTRTSTNMADWNMDVSLVTTTTGAHISFNHPLNNDTSTDDYDVSPYIITFTLRHKDDHSYAKTVTIEQRPAIVIDSQLNSDGTADNYRGYVYINNVSSNSNYTEAWCRNSTLSGQNSNPNMYLISTSVLSDSDMLIGDPRTTTPYRDTDLVSGWSSASTRFIDGTTGHRLTNYYPAESDEAFKDVIAPVFRVASSYGKSTSMSFNDARRRCASYQEDGYPAGRWRLPTMAEVLYITTLSQKSMIPELFTFDRNAALDKSYWCASGKIDGVYGVPTYFSGTTDDNRWVRCVYDEWYWSGMTYNNQDAERVDISTFTWGDIPR